MVSGSQFLLINHLHPPDEPAGVGGDEREVSLFLPGQHALGVIFVLRSSGAPESCDAFSRSVRRSRGKKLHFHCLCLNALAHYTYLIHYAI